jgi:heat shock protein beta
MAKVRQFSLGTLERLTFAFVILIVLPTFCSFVHAEQESFNIDQPDPELKPETIAVKTDDNVIAREEEQMSNEGFSIKEQKILKEQAAKFKFEAEVDKLMKIIINSLYSNTEVFLRELISNASDALDKIRFLSLTDTKQLDSGSQLEIRIKIDSDRKTLTISDTGVGMTREELVKNLGTIAQSGTSDFLKAYSGAGGDTSLIGQFGVGFYSAFLVADVVTVTSKHNNDTQHVWRSDAQGSFSVSEDPRGNTLGRGTSITLHIKEEQKQFLDENTIKSLVKKYSEFINFPIYLWLGHEEEKEVPLTEEELKGSDKEENEEENEEISIDEETSTNEEPSTEEKPKTKLVKETVWEWELMNETKPIWTRSPKEITEEEYHNFYKSFSKDLQDPLFYIHFMGEGEVEFKSLLYIPGSAPSNMFDPNNADLRRNVKLYVRRVFITDDFKDLLPKYLLFIKGVVDSDDLPLNVSREMLQEHRLLKLIKKKIVRKAIAMFQQLLDSEDQTKYKEFWKNYGINIKLGIMEDGPNRVRLSKLLMFHSSKTGELSSLDSYVSRMKEGQTQIYYLAGESKESVETSPLLEKLIKKGYEVLYMTDPIDEYCLANLEKFDGKYKITNIGREGLKLDGDEKEEEKEKEIEEKYSPLLSFLKKTLGSKVEKVTVSSRLTQSPTALVSSAGGWTANMERIIKAQALSDPKSAQVNIPKRILEINPRHPLIKELLEKVKINENDPVAVDIAGLMYDTAALTSGFSLEEPAELASKIQKLLYTTLNIDSNIVEEPVEEEEPQKPVEEEPQITEKDEL